jgi:hypothetical protein
VPERKTTLDPKAPQKAAPRIQRVVENIPQVNDGAPIAVEPPPKPAAAKFHLRIEKALARRADRKWPGLAMSAGFASTVSAR